MQAGAGIHVTGAVGIHRLDFEPRHQCLSPRGDGKAAALAQRDVHRPADVLEFGDRDVEAIGLGPSQSFFLIAEQMVDTITENLCQIVPEELHHAGIGQADRRLHTGGLGQLAAGDGGRHAARRRRKIAFGIEVAGLAECLLVDLAQPELGGDAEKGVHGALGVWCHQYQAAARVPWLFRGSRIAVGHHAGGAEVAEKIPTYLVFGNSAGVERFAAEALHSNDGVGRRPAAHALRLMVLQVVDQRREAFFVHQSHVPLGDAVAA